MNEKISESSNQEHVSLKTGGVSWKDRKKAIKTLKTYGLLGFPASLIITYYLYTVFVSFGVANIQKVIVWLVFANFVWFGEVFLYYRNLMVIEKAKEAAKMPDFFSTAGRKKILADPDSYFSPEDFKRYKSNLIFVRNIRILGFIALLLIAVFARNL